MKLVYEGILTAGYYNAMEAGDPVFIDEESLSDIVKNLLDEREMDFDFCYGFGSSEDSNIVKNPLIGKKVILTLEIED